MVDQARESLCYQKEHNIFSILKEAVIIYDWDGGGRDMGEGLEKIQYPKRDFEKVFDSREGYFKAPKIPGEGLNVDQISSYGTSIQILMSSLQYANMITFRSHDDSNLILYGSHIILE